MLLVTNQLLMGVFLCEAGCSPFVSLSVFFFSFFKSMGFNSMPEHVATFLISYIPPQGLLCITQLMDQQWTFYLNINFLLPSLYFSTVYTITLFWLLIIVCFSQWGDEPWPWWFAGGFINSSPFSIVMVAKKAAKPHLNPRKKVSLQRWFTVPYSFWSNLHTSFLEKKIIIQEY